MNAYATFVVNQHIGTLQQEAAERRVRAADKPQGSGRIARIVASLNRSIDQAAEDIPRLIPAHTAYPYRV